MWLFFKSSSLLSDLRLHFTMSFRFNIHSTDKIYTVSQKKAATLLFIITYTVVELFLQFLYRAVWQKILHSTAF